MKFRAICEYEPNSYEAFDIDQEQNLLTFPWYEEWKEFSETTWERAMEALEKMRKKNYLALMREGITEQEKEERLENAANFKALLEELNEAETCWVLEGPSVDFQTTVIVVKE